MPKTATKPGISLQASDVSGQKTINIKNAPPDATVGELVRSALAGLRLPANVPWQARLEREGRHLHFSERVGDALETGDRLTLQPNIDAG